MLHVVYKLLLRKKSGALPGMLHQAEVGWEGFVLVKWCCCHLGSPVTVGKDDFGK